LAGLQVVPVAGEFKWGESANEIATAACMKVLVNELLSFFFFPTLPHCQPLQTSKTLVAHQSLKVNQ